MNKDYNRAIKILQALPTIRSMIAKGTTWNSLKELCEPLGLTDTAFRDLPRNHDYLVSYDYWIGRLHEISKEHDQTNMIDPIHKRAIVCDQCRHKGENMIGCWSKGHQGLITFTEFISRAEITIYPQKEQN